MFSSSPLLKLTKHKFYQYCSIVMGKDACHIEALGVITPAISQIGQGGRMCPFELSYSLA